MKKNTKTVSRKGQPCKIITGEAKRSESHVNPGGEVEKKLSGGGFKAKNERVGGKSGYGNPTKAGLSSVAHRRLKQVKFLSRKARRGIASEELTK